MMKRIFLLALAFAVPAVASAGVREDWQAVADALRLAGQDAAAANIEAAVSKVSDEELEAVYERADLIGLAEVFMDNADSFNAIDDMVTARETAVAGPETLSPGFPDAVGYPTSFFCPFSPDRSNADDLIIAVNAIAAARVALEVAEGVWSIASRGCEQVAVVAGFGGNTSLACIPADVVFIVAKALVGAAESVVENLSFCDGAVDSAEIEGSYERAGHIHDDLTTHDADISNQLATHDADISNQLATHDADISNQLATHDTDIKLQLATHDADIKTLLADIQGAVDENQRLIKIFMSRQLEIMRLLITPQGQREVNEQVLTCTGDDCPETPGFQLCPNGSLKWNRR